MTAGTRAQSFDLDGLTLGCLWDTSTTTTATASTGNLTAANNQLTTTNSTSNATLSTSHYPGVACLLELTCQAAAGAGGGGSRDPVSRLAFNWRPGGSWSSDIMGRWFGLGTPLKGRGSVVWRLWVARGRWRRLLLWWIRWRIGSMRGAGGGGGC